MRLRISSENLEELPDQLRRLAKVYPEAARSALRTGAQRGRQEFLKITFEALTISKSQATKIVRPVRQNKAGQASFLVSAKRIGLHHFEVQEAGAGIRVRIAKDKGFEFYEHAFEWRGTGPESRGYYQRRRYHSDYGPASFRGKGINWKSPGKGQPKGGKSAESGLVFRHPMKRLEGRRLTSYFYHNESRIMKRVGDTAFIRFVDAFDKRMRFERGTIFDFT